ncbi:MAG: LamG domain-containing protein, partial [Verrucomicrobia bacterium]|nr:LamG domain-containing protein [Verrucomicrobiota bacterium]
GSFTPKINIESITNDLSFDLSTPNDLLLGTDFTMEFYMKPDQPVIASAMFGLSPVSGLSFILGVTSELVLRGSFQGQIDNLIPATLVQIGQWQHFALVMEASEYNVFIDGQLQYNGPLPSGGEGPYSFPGTNITGDRTIGGDSGTWRGYIDEFRISDEALSPDQFLNAVPEPNSLLLILAGLALVRVFCVFPTSVGKRG